MALVGPNNVHLPSSIWEVIYKNCDKTGRACFPLICKRLRDIIKNNIKIKDSKDQYFVLPHKLALYAAAEGHKGVLNWALEKGFPNEIKVKNGIQTAQTYAASMNQNGILEYLKDKGLPLDHLDMGVAARCGHEGTIEYLRELGIPLTCQVFTDAVEKRRAKVIDWLLKNNCPQSWTDIYKVTSQKNSILSPKKSYIHEILSITEIAAKEGHLQTLQWGFRQEGIFPCIEQLLQICHNDVKTWLQEAWEKRTGTY